MIYVVIAFFAFFIIAYYTVSINDILGERRHIRKKYKEQMKIANKVMEEDREVLKKLS